MKFLPNDKTIDWPNFKAFADDNLNVAKMAKLVFDRVKNIEGKGENASHQHFPTMFSKGRSKSGLCGKGLSPPAPLQHNMPNLFQ